jgi:hypothetical protein
MTIEYTEWTRLNSIEDVAIAKRNGWDIESSEGGAYRPWDGCGWHCNITYRARPKKPKTVTVRLLGWYSGMDLIHRVEGAAVNRHWLRVPGEDKVVEVEP